MHTHIPLHKAHISYAAYGDLSPIGMELWTKNSNFDSIFDPHSQKLHACVPPRGGRGENFLYRPKGHPMCIPTNIKRTFAVANCHLGETLNSTPKVENCQKCQIGGTFCPPAGGVGGKIPPDPQKARTHWICNKMRYKPICCHFLFRLYDLIFVTKKKINLPEIFLSVRQ